MDVHVLSVVERRAPAQPCAHGSACWFLDGRSQHAAVLRLQYRTLVNYRSPEFLGPRIGDKVVFSLLVRLTRP